MVAESVIVVVIVAVVGSTTLSYGPRYRCRSTTRLARNHDSIVPPRDPVPPIPIPDAAAIRAHQLHVWAPTPPFHALLRSAVRICACSRGAERRSCVKGLDLYVIRC